MIALVCLVVCISLIGWTAHLIFIIHAIGNKGVVELDYNSYHEMYPELVIIIIFLVLTVFCFGYLLNELIGV